MKFLNTANKLLVTLITGAVLTTGANAAVNYTGNATTLYTGVKTGQFDIKNDKMQLEKPIAFGLYGGINFTQNFGAELEYMSSNDTDFTKGLLSLEYKAETLGAYGTYRMPLTNGIYAKGKLGYAQTNLVIDGNKDNKIDNAGLAGGVGIGMDITPSISIEGEYTKLPSVDLDAVELDASLMSIGANFRF